MVTRRDYTAEAVEAAKRVLIELVHRLGEYRNGVVVVGGWVPYLLLANHEQSAHREHGYRSGRGPQALAALSGADVEATVVAEREGIPCQFKLPPRGGTDAGAIRRSRGGVLTGIVSVPYRCIHSPFSHLPSYRLRPHVAAPGRILQGLAGGPSNEPDCIRNFFQLFYRRVGSFWSFPQMVCLIRNIQFFRHYAPA